MTRSPQGGPHGLGRGICGRRRQSRRQTEQRGILPEGDCHSPAVGAQPDDLAAGAELIEQFRAVLGHARGQDLALPHLGSERKALEREEHLPQPLDPAAAADPAHRVPVEREARQRGLLDRLDLAAQARDRGAADTAQHLDVTPLAAPATRSQRAVDERSLALERRQFGLGDVRIECVTGRERPRREWPAPARVARDQAAQGVVHGLEEGRRHAPRRHHAEGIAIAAGILGRDQAVLAADADTQRAAVGEQSRAGARCLAGQPRRDLAFAQVADAAQEVVERVGAPATLAGELVLDLVESVGVEQIAQLVGAGELAQQVAVERQRGDAPLRRRRVVFVQVLGDVLEVERGGERRRALRLDGDELAAAVAQSRQQLA
jgi:hypothetical protein